MKFKIKFLAGVFITLSFSPNTHGMKKNKTSFQEQIENLKHNLVKTQKAIFGTKIQEFSTSYYDAIVGNNESIKNLDSELEDLNLHVQNLENKVTNLEKKQTNSTTPLKLYCSHCRSLNKTTANHSNAFNDLKKIIYTFLFIGTIYTTRQTLKYTPKEALQMIPVFSIFVWLFFKTKKIAVPRH